MPKTKSCICSTLMCSLVFLLGSAAALARQPLEPRSLIDRTQRDLQHAENFEHRNGKDVGRYNHAERQLSDFDRDLTQGHFDRGKLNDAIGSLQDVVKHNTLTPVMRDQLSADLRDMRVMRAEQAH